VARTAFSGSWARALTNPRPMPLDALSTWRIENVRVSWNPESVKSIGSSVRNKRKDGLYPVMSQTGMRKAGRGPRLILVSAGPLGLGLKVLL
jgi:hypothetical protein